MIQRRSSTSLWSHILEIHILGFNAVVLVLWRPFHWCINYQCRTDIDEAKVISAICYKSKFEFQTFFEKIPIFCMFPWCSTSENISIDVLITNVGLILTKLRWFQHKSKFEFRTFLKRELNFLSFSCFNTREDLSIDVSITNVGLILTKLRWFQLFSTRQNSNFELYEKRIQLFKFSCCSTREDLSINVSITNVDLILTKLRWFQLFVTSQNSNFELFFIFWFSWCSTCEDLSIDVSITNVGLILAKLRWFQLFVTSQNSNFELKKSQIFGFLCCSTREDLSIDASVTNVGLIWTKLWWLLSSGADSQTRFWNPHMETCRDTKNFNSKLKISG